MIAPKYPNQVCNAFVRKNTGNTGRA